jgi:hypothetical protein
VPEQTDIQRDLQTLTAELRQLELEYTMFFSGRLPRPPWETRGRVEAILKRWDRTGRIDSAADRFRFTTLQTRYHTFADLWDRGMRAREEGRPGPFARASQSQPAAPAKPEDKVLHVTSFKDPRKEMDKLHDLYESLMDARREAGEKVVPFHKFADLVKEQVKQLRAQGNPEVAFRVAVKDGQVSLTARGLKGMPE